MKVSEIKQLEPQVDVYELLSSSKYVVVAARNQMSPAAMESLLTAMVQQGLSVSGLYLDDVDAVRFFEFHASPPAEEIEGVGV